MTLEPFEEFSFVEDRAGADQGDQVRGVDRPPSASTIPLGRRIDGSMRKYVPQQRRHADLAVVDIRNPTLSPIGPSRMMTLWSIGPIGDSTCVWS